MKELKEKAQALMDRYTSELSGKGLKILLSKRYFESGVCERSGLQGVGAVFNAIDRARDRKNEEKNGYNYERNKYHYFVMTVCPIEATAIRREECRDYAFLLKKVERAHIGLEPRLVVLCEESVLSKMEKRIRKILKRAEKHSAQKVCRNTLTDAFRYTHPKYEYKKRFLGKESSTWDMIFLVAFCTLVFGGLFVAWLVSR